MRSVAGVVEFLAAVMAVLGIGFGNVAVDLKREGRRGVNLEVTVAAGTRVGDEQQWQIRFVKDEQQQQRGRDSKDEQQQQQGRHF
ncbi:hypothetical protein WN943_003292 [Citrus x changshan-huyou]